MRKLQHWPGQTLQSLYSEVSRLVSLAYPGDRSASVEADSVDCFINAFLSNRMKERMRDKGLETLTEVKLWAVTLESYGDDDCSVV